MIKTIKGCVLYRKDFLGEDDWRLSFAEMEFAGFVTVCCRDFEVEIPDDFDPRAKQIEILERDRTRISAEFSARCTEIQSEINKLTALEHVK
jgi:hypothetical protein